MYNKKNRVLISDFDGTISKKDFFWYVIDELLSQDDMQPWEDYLAKKITHIEALTRIFSKIRLSEKEFNDFILSLPIEDCFVKTAQYCHQNNIGFYIISAGADFYIKYILKHLKVDNIVTLISNKSFYKSESGLVINKPDKNSQFYSENYGVNKKLAVEFLKNKYDFSIFAGDGGPDFEAAKVADKVFARDRLLELCQTNNIKSSEFTTYCDILDYLKND
ncbi:MAG: MtnX-like HAD-IB family phosphatase [Candidatus Gastranaerophilales bacterium]|nr:MtnX-like HAD-IB family phosphatase [Candidatus Gastranaerophilales bacterium]